MPSRIRSTPNRNSSRSSKPDGAVADVLGPGNPVQPRVVSARRPARAAAPRSSTAGAGSPPSGPRSSARRAGRVVGHPGLAQGVGAEQADDPELVGVRQAGAVESLQAALDEGQRVRGERRRGHRHLGDPRMPVDHARAGPVAHHRSRDRQPSPSSTRSLGALRAGVPHQLEQLVLAGDVAVQRHGGEAELLGHAGHRDRLQALGVGRAGSAAVDDRVDRQPAPGPAAAALAPPPQQVEPGRQRRSRLARSLRRSLPALRRLLRVGMPSLTVTDVLRTHTVQCMSYTVKATGISKSFGGHPVLDHVDLAVDDRLRLRPARPERRGQDHAWCASWPPWCAPTRARRRSPATTCSPTRSASSGSISLTGQYAAVDDLLTGQENLEMMARLRHLPPRAARARAAELLADFDLADAARPAGRHLLRRHEAPARPGDQHDRAAQAAVPGRAHHRARPAQPRAAVGHRPPIWSTTA